jgi:hypothetical protein
MRAFMGIFLLSLLASSPAIAESCDEDAIDKVSNDGAIITVATGATFRVNRDGRIDAALWVIGDDILICKEETEIVNKDQNNEHVTVRRID